MNNYPLLSDVEPYLLTRIGASGYDAYTLAALGMDGHTRVMPEHDPAPEGIRRTHCRTAPPRKPDELTTTEAARLLGILPEALSRLARQGKVGRFVTVGRRAVYRYTREEIARFGRDGG